MNSNSGNVKQGTLRGQSVMAPYTDLGARFSLSPFSGGDGEALLGLRDVPLSYKEGEKLLQPWNGCGLEENRGLKAERQGPQLGAPRETECSLNSLGPATPGKSVQDAARGQLIS